MVCLTFDDGLLCHYKTVIPALNRRGMKGNLLRPDLSAQRSERRRVRCSVPRRGVEESDLSRTRDRRSQCSTSPLSEEVTIQSARRETREKGQFRRPSPSETSESRLLFHGNGNQGRATPADFEPARQGSNVVHQSLLRLRRSGRCHAPWTGYVNLSSSARPPSCESHLSQREHPSILLQASLYVEKRSDEHKRLQYCGRLSLKTARGGESPWSIVCTR
jgi:hypothetical protein